MVLCCISFLFHLVVYFFSHHVDGLFQVCVVGHRHCTSVEAVVEEHLCDVLVVELFKFIGIHCLNHLVEGIGDGIVELLFALSGLI